jgi:hypothetical protein
MEYLFLVKGLKVIIVEKHSITIGAERNREIGNRYTRNEKTLWWK